ncbi:sensor histidine kinase [hydrocarbon metagenome]|uniref:Sensor histidine kinase n=1 Tax=hydrocarbon metagenome TaxID=938273 RepID=A0A0W8FU55_9ZZZZ
MEEYLRNIVELSLGSTPEELLKASLETCIKLTGATGGSILGEEGVHLQFLFSDVAELIGVRVPFDSIAGVSVKESKVVYTYAPTDKRHFDGVDAQIQHKTKYLLSIPIRSILKSTGADRAANNAGALQLLFEKNIFPEIDVEQGAQEFTLISFEENRPFMDRLKGIIWILPIVAFGMEVTRLRQTSYQAIHELKNKLISGLSWIKYLKEDIRQMSPSILNDDNIKQDFELSESAIREGANLARMYLEFTNIYNPHFAPVNINDVLAETAESVKALAVELKASNFTIELDLDKKIGLKNLDASQLKMAFFNLCKNGVEALVEHNIPDPGIMISSSAQNGHTAVTISDNGPGIPREIAKNLFVAFKTKKEGGTGLGLAITKKIIDVHGGTIKCNISNKGTSFTIIL